MGLTSASLSGIRSIGLILLLVLGMAQSAAGQQAVDLSLDSLLQTPVSTAGKYTQTVRDAAASITIVTAAQIADNGWTELEELLATVPGLYFADDRTTSHMGVRGFDRLHDFNNRILVLVDGHSLNDPVVSAGPSGVEAGIDLATLDRVEVLRGSGSTLYGSSAMLAVVNLITKPAVDGVYANGTAGSYGDRRISAGIGKRLTSGLNLAVSGHLGASDGPNLYYPEYSSDSASGGSVRGGDRDRLAAARFRADYRGFTLQGQYDRFESGVPTGAYGATFGDTLATQNGDRGFLELRYERDLGSPRQLRVRVFADHNRFQRDIPFPGFLAGYEVRGTSVGGEATLRWDLGSRQRLTLGTQYRDNTEARVTTSSPIGVAPSINSPYGILSAFVVDEFDLTRWLTVLGGVSHDRYSTGANITAPRGAVVIRPDGVTSLKLIYGRAFRVPTVLERVFGADALPNPALRPEQINSFELVVQRQVGRGLLATSSLFYYDVADLVESVFVPADSQLHYQNAGAVRAHGAEAGLEARLGHGHTGYVNWSHTIASNEVDGARLTNSPVDLVKAGLVARILPSLSAAVEGRFESSRTTASGSATDPFFVGNVNLNWYPLGISGPFDASFRINNVFNASYSTPGGLELRQAAILQNGRNLLFTLGAKF